MPRLLMLVLIGLLVASPVYAEPPAHAPAHGWRAKQKGKHPGKREYLLPLYDEYPYTEVNCEPGTDIVSQVIGGVAGGLIGDQFGKGKGNDIAAISGAIIGTLIADQMNLPKRDISCMYQALESGKHGNQVAWRNPDNGSLYNFLPIGDYTYRDRPCRNYKMRVQIGDEVREERGRACRLPDGRWEVM